MSNAPVFEIDPQLLWRDPYPIFAELRARAPIAYVPQLDAVVLSRLDDVSACERPRRRLQLASTSGPDE